MLLLKIILPQLLIRQSQIKIIFYQQKFFKSSDTEWKLE